MAQYECRTCGGTLLVKIGADTAVCDHCGQCVALDPQDVRQYQETYQSALRLMRTGTLAGYTAALTRLQSISFIPEARKTAAACERQMEALRAAKAAPRNHAGSDRNNTALGVVIVVLTVLLLLLVLGGLGFLVYHLIKGDLSTTQIIVLAVAAAVLAALLLIGKLKG